MAIGKLLEIGELKKSKFGKFSLEDFTLFYVENALEISRKNPNFSDYESRLLEKVSSRFEMNRGSVRYLSNPFHWGFFNGDDPILEVIVREEDKKPFAEAYNYVRGKDYSPKEEAMALLELSGQFSYVFLNGSKDSAETIASSIVDKYGKYFEARIKKLGLIQQNPQDESL